MSEALVLTRQEGAVWYVTLNREAKRNALTIEFTEAIAEAVREVDGKPEIRAIIVEGNGPVFCAGIDVMSLMATKMATPEGNAARWLRTYAERLQHAMHRIEQVEVPVIGAMQGKCMGMGLEMALAFDFRVIGEGTMISLPETKLGLIADVGGTTRLTKLIGPSRTKDMLMTAREIASEEALSWGLVNRVAPDGQIAEAALGLAHDIMKNAPLAVGLAKLVIDQGDGVDRYTQMTIERLAQSYLITTEDIGEAMGAFMEKRAPEWKGA